MGVLKSVGYFKVVIVKLSLRFWPIFIISLVHSPVKGFMYEPTICELSASSAYIVPRTFDLCYSYIFSLKQFLTNTCSIMGTLLCKWRRASLESVPNFIKKKIFLFNSFAFCTVYTYTIIVWFVKKWVWNSIHLIVSFRSVKKRYVFTVIGLNYQYFVRQLSCLVWDFFNGILWDTGVLTQLLFGDICQTWKFNNRGNSDT